jgi:3-oxoacyl-[acyl-carrier protein] reductase/7-alpha-hydroxysteroid dehydrogenase
MGHKYFGRILEGKRVLITGGNRGLGLLMARRFLECGAKVAICSAPFEDVAEAVQQLKNVDASFEVMGIKPNLSDEAEVETVMRIIEAGWGGLDILINNAGIYPFKPFEEYPQELFKNVFDVNVTGLFTVSQKAVELMKKNPNGGVILNTSSLAGISGSMANIGYTASKYAVQGMTLGMARELGKYKIRVNGVAPAGMYKTDVNGNVMESQGAGALLGQDGDEFAEKFVRAAEAAKHFQPLGDYQCHPDEMINAFIFLASDAAKFISGQTIAVDGACIWPAANPMSGI